MPERFLYLTTIGRVSGQPRTIEIWFVEHDGAFYVGTLTTFPVQVGAARIYKITPDGNLTVLAPHLTAILALAFDQQGQLYALQTSDIARPYLIANAGDVVRVDPNTEQGQIIATGLTFPTGMTFGPDGMLYISNNGFGFRAAGRGHIVRLSVPPGS